MSHRCDSSSHFSDAPADFPALAWVVQYSQLSAQDGVDERFERRKKK